MFSISTALTGILQYIKVAEHQASRPIFEEKKALRCIRNNFLANRYVRRSNRPPPAATAAATAPPTAPFYGLLTDGGGVLSRVRRIESTPTPLPVSYTHLTLPTIYPV